MSDLFPLPSPSWPLPAAAAMSPSTVLVTGASGYLGQFIVQYFAAQGRKVVRPGALPTVIALYFALRDRIACAKQCSFKMPGMLAAAAAAAHPPRAAPAPLAQQVGCTYCTGEAPQFEGGDVTAFRVSAVGRGAAASHSCPPTYMARHRCQPNRRQPLQWCLLTPARCAACVPLCVAPSACLWLPAGGPGQR
jgi:hypothetical protein